MIRRNIHPSTLAIASALLLAACGPTPQPAAPAAVPAADVAAAPASVDTTTPPAPAAAPAGAPSDAAQRYEGKLIRQPPGVGGKDDGWYLVQGGKRRWVSDGAWLAKNGFTPEQVVEVSSEEFHAIPEDPEPLQ